tara:strand:- start:45 stop:266 length:222 start_codon:yes stop_codon:yes gene_type:complete
MSRDRQYEYRILYKVDGSVNSSYHYYLAYSAEQALSFQEEMADHKGWSIETLSIEEKNPYSMEWEDCSEVINK